jgi:hypothetical protein
MIARTPDSPATVNQSRAAIKSHRTRPAPQRRRSGGGHPSERIPSCVLTNASTWSRMPAVERNAFACGQENGDVPLMQLSGRTRTFDSGASAGRDSGDAAGAWWTGHGCSPKQGSHGMGHRPSKREAEAPRSAGTAPSVLAYRRSYPLLQLMGQSGDTITHLLQIGRQNHPGPLVAP